MGGSESKPTTRKVSFGLDEEEKVTIIQGVTGSQEDSVKKPEDLKPGQVPKPGPTSLEIQQEELRKRFEREQALVQEQLAKLAQREREAAAVSSADPQDATPAVLRERNKTQEQVEKNKLLPAEVDAWAKQLQRKEAELQSLSAFYKEQLSLLEKKGLEYYKQSSEQYNQAATKAEAHIQRRPTGPACPELQSQVAQCYRDNRDQTLHCSGLAKDYLLCIHAAKKNLLVS